MNPHLITTRELLRVLIYNATIALFLSLLTPYDFTINLIYSQSIGFGIFFGIHASRRLSGRSKPAWKDAAIGIPLGFACGFALASWLNGYSLAQILAEHPRAIGIGMAAALLFGIIAMLDVINRSRLLEAEVVTREAQLRRSELEASTTQAELARLQAQIEPHFLFNTLSNVVSLIDTDPAAARQMLLDLTALLRTTLARTRQGRSTLGEELDLLRAYLGIMAIRMGERLVWEIEADPETLTLELPPLLLQPLVENALRHGLEPKPAGGRLSIRCRMIADRLDIEIADNGIGPEASPDSGIGLTNVRNRLLACYGNAAQLHCTANADGGFCAHLDLPGVMHAPLDR